MSAEEPKRLRPRLRDAWARLRGGEVTPLRAAASVAVGLAIGVTPLWGLHWAIVLAVCVPLKLDTPIAFLASNISLPFIAPFITLGEIELGALALRGHLLALDVEAVKANGVGAFAAELALGTVAMAIVCAAIGGGIAYAFVALRARRRSNPRAREN